MENYWVVKDERLNTKTQDVINEYLLDLKLSNKSEETIKLYKGYLVNSFITLTKSLSELTSDDILDYIRNTQINYKESTISRYLSILKCFFNYCVEEEYIVKNLVKSRWKPRILAPIPKFLDASELAKVKLEVEKLSLMERTIFEFLLSSGSRVGEVHKLNIDDVDLESRTAVVLGKGNKIRQVHFNENCKILLEKYIDTHPIDVEPLFLDKNNNRLSIGTIQRMVNRLGEKANLSRRISVHCTRHCFSTILLNKGASLDFIAAELGHNDIQTSRRYARLLNSQMFRLYKMYME